MPGRGTDHGRQGHPVKELRTYGDGDVLDAPGALRAVHTPGHTGGHSCLLAERAGVLFAGDTLGTMDFLGGPSGAQLLRFNEDADRARNSLSRLEALPASVVVVGHGRLFQATPAAAVDRGRAPLTTPPDHLGEVAPQTATAWTGTERNVELVPGRRPGTVRALGVTPRQPAAAEER